MLRVSDTCFSAQASKYKVFQPTNQDTANVILRRARPSATEIRGTPPSTGFAMLTPASPLLLFDGVCTLCNAAVDFVMRHDRTGRIRFASLQSEAGQAVLREAGLPEGYADSLVLVDAGVVWTKSDAALHLARLMGGAWSLAAPLLAIPRAARDAVYDAIAARRYEWFGKREACRLPSPEERARFVETAEDLRP